MIFKHISWCFRIFLKMFLRQFFIFRINLFSVNFFLSLSHLFYVSFFESEPEQLVYKANQCLALVAITFFYFPSYFFKLCIFSVQTQILCCLSSLLEECEKQTKKLKLEHKKPFSSVEWKGCSSLFVIEESEEKKKKKKL